MVNVLSCQMGNLNKYRTINFRGKKHQTNKILGRSDNGQIEQKT